MDVILPFAMMPALCRELLRKLAVDGATTNLMGNAP